MEDPRERPDIPDCMRAEMMRIWAREGVLAVPRRPQAELLRQMLVKGWERPLLREEALRLLPWEDDERAVDGRVVSVDGSEKERIEGTDDDDGGGGSGSGGREGEEGVRYVYQELRHLVVNSVMYDYQVGRGRPGSSRIINLHGNTFAVPTPDSEVSAPWGSGELEIERRRCAIGLRWDALEKLETLCLDLRGYSLRRWPSCIKWEEVEQLARALQGKGLGLLVLAGLRSYGLFPGPEPLEFGEGGLAGGKWLQMFEGAVRPGGRIVLVDGCDMWMDEPVVVGHAFVRANGTIAPMELWV
ncbi:hypothetical protein VTJ04DRAFT_3659 [Mycothermus thermophilus]|uniref:uncharacterized protein n=1 Tax=Humicola insolens TaxID=85995 RepID=UPI00374301E5